MTKLRTEYACWRLSRGLWLLLLSDLEEGNTYCVKVSDDLNITQVDLTDELPDVRLHYPIVFNRLPVRVRAVIRSWIQTAHDLEVLKVERALGWYRESVKQ